MKSRVFLAIAAFAVFTTYTVMVALDHGLTGFIGDVALAGGWGTQVFLDLIVALVLFSGFMWTDARKRGIPPLPYLIAILTCGSVGALAYLVHRSLKSANTPTPQTATA